MKMYFKSLIFALTGALMITACSNEIEEQLAEGSGNSGQEVKFTVGIENLSRTTIAEGSLKTEFVEGDEIGIFAYDGETAVASNVKYTYGGSAWTSDNAIAAQDGVQLSYYAYYPYSESVTDPSAINVTVNSDQATNGFSKDDVLTAKNTEAEAGAPSVSLTFAHAMAMVQVSLMQGTTDDADATVSLQSILPDTKVNAKDGSVVAATGEPVAVAMKKAAESLTYRAVVPEQTITANSKLLTIVAGGKTFDVTFNADVKYEKGKLLQIKVEALNGLPEGAIVTIGGETIDGWIPGEEPEGGEAEEQPMTLLDLTSLPNFDISTISTYESNWSSAKIMGDTDFWFVRDVNNYVTYVSEEIESVKTLKLVVEEPYTKQASWNYDCVGFHSAGIYEKEKYVLTFDMMTDGTTSTVGFAITNSDDTKLFQICNGSWVDYERTVHTFKVEDKANQWVSQTMRFNFAKSSTTGKSSGVTDFAETSDSEVAKGINLIFYNYTAAANNLWLRNIKLTKYVSE